MTQIDYYFTLNSPWSFMGGIRLAKMAKAHGASVNTKPAILARCLPKPADCRFPSAPPHAKLIA